MSILDTSAPKAPTIVDLQQKYKDTIQVQIRQSFTSVTATFQNLFRLVWQNPELNPQQVMDAFGSDAVQLFQIAAAFQAAVNTVVPGTLPEVPPYNFTIEQDGSVSIGSPIA